MVITPDHNMITSGSGEAIDSRVFLGDSQFRGELIRGGVPNDKILIPAYSGQAYPLIRECEGVIQAAVLGEYLMSKDDRERIKVLHSNLRGNNPHVQIYHLVHPQVVDSLKELEKAGLARLLITELLPSPHQGHQNNHPLYLLGKELTEKYFS